MNAIEFADIAVTPEQIATLHARNAWTRTNDTDSRYWDRWTYTDGSQVTCYWENWHTPRYTYHVAIMRNGSVVESLYESTLDAATQIVENYPA